ncbi:lysylphosphatidylglycerol synthase transmembrane domain-containing protein [Virgibacillus sp. DJP39]|uniref:lysylphosphatidylglycerol synthase transmembrane domain-containing protein n=1 Tax=Virgibacillus sp. DJP39 TaxID=3409790 RepID=UPI003BB6AE2D
MNKYIMQGAKLLIAICFIWVTAYAFDFRYILNQASEILSNFFLLSIMTLSYFFAFLIKAKVWQLYVGKGIGFKLYFDGVLYSLVLNHLLPVKAGDLVRIGYLAQENKVGWAASIQSVVVMRLIDLFLLGAIALGGALYLGIKMSLLFVFSVLGIVGIIIILVLIKKYKWREMIFSYLKTIKQILWSGTGFMIICLILLSWCLEAIVLFSVASQFGISLSYLSSLWVNSFTIAGQVFHFSPGGIGTYESFMSFALTVFAVPLKESYTIAIVTHGFKFLFSYVMGIYLLLFAPISWLKLINWLKRKEE